MGTRGRKPGPRKIRYYDYKGKSYTLGELSKKLTDEWGKDVKPLHISYRMKRGASLEEAIEDLRQHGVRDRKKFYEYKGMKLELLDIAIELGGVEWEPKLRESLDSGLGIMTSVELVKSMIDNIVKPNTSAVNRCLKDLDIPRTSKSVIIKFRGVDVTFMELSSILYSLENIIIGPQGLRQSFHQGKLGTPEDIEEYIFTKKRIQLKYVVNASRLIYVYHGQEGTYADLAKTFGFTDIPLLDIIRYMKLKDSSFEDSVDAIKLDNTGGNDVLQYRNRGNAKLYYEYAGGKYTLQEIASKEGYPVDYNSLYYYVKSKKLRVDEALDIIWKKAEEGGIEDVPKKEEPKRVSMQKSNLNMGHIIKLPITEKLRAVQNDTNYTEAFLKVTKDGLSLEEAIKHTNKIVNNSGYIFGNGNTPEYEKVFVTYKGKFLHLRTLMELLGCDYTIKEVADALPHITLDYNEAILYLDKKYGVK